MPALAPTLVLIDVSIDGAKELALDLFDRMQRDWWATAYWGFVWTCGFVATFLFLRMLFTRWGDRDVTKKTLGLSLLVHALVGTLSTTVIFGTSAGPDGGPDRVMIGRVVADGGTADLRGGTSLADAPAIGGQAKKGKSAAWDRAPKFDPQRPSRLERELAEASDNSLAQNRPASEPVSIPTPALTDQTPRAEPLPATTRLETKLAAPTETTSAPIAEETAQARPEANAKAPLAGRGVRGDPQATRSEEPHRNRPQTSDDLEIAADNSPGASEASKAFDLAARVRGDENSTGPARPATKSPKSVAADDGSADAAAPQAGPGRGSTTGRTFSRIGRSSRESADSQTIERSRPGDSSGRASGETILPGSGPTDAIVAGRLSGDIAGEGLSPSISRSDSGGAIDKHAGKVPATYRLRSSPQRKKIAIEMGANEESERAVESSLQWLADHQHPQGYWEPIESTIGREPDNTARFDNPKERERSGFHSDAGLTALAVLAFLGKGYTHEDNSFSENVDRALRWLVSQQDSQGFLGGKANRYARMYCHGMAAIAIGEAYGMTKDPALREPLARAVQFIVDAQNADGGWRYFKGKEGDMSMFGWQLMALKSAKTAGLPVPNASMNRAIDFLIDHGDDLKARGLSQYGGLAAYRRGAAELPKPSMTAESLFCKQMLGIKRTNRASIEAVEFLQKNLPRHSKQDLYYWYYGTLAMYHHGGDAWLHWNQALRDSLVADQRTDGEFAGSWNPRAPWGDYGGRVFSTALSTLCLEVYYRFLPLYQSEDAQRLEQQGGKAE